LKQASTVQGTAQARVTILKRERDALDRQNARTDRCAEYYDELARGMK
jgi:hypothetical protein